MRLASLVATLLVATSLSAQTPSFVNDVEPILTRLGCNQGACHGKGAGQNGFRLSLRAYAPEWDYFWITREQEGRRIQTGVPEQSLLLLKPLAVVPHEGGKLLAVDSPEYRTLLAWITAGAPGVKKDEPTVRRVELLPGDQGMKTNAEGQLAVRGGDSHGGAQEGSPPPPVLAH